MVEAMAELALFMYPFPGLVILVLYAVASGWVPAMTAEDVGGPERQIVARTKRARWRFVLLLMAELVFLRVVWTMLAVRGVQASLDAYTKAETRAAFDDRALWTKVGFYTTLVAGGAFLIMTLRELYRRNRSLLWVDLPALVYLGLWFMTMSLHVMMSSGSRA